jgi:hypothetical protein
MSVLTKSACVCASSGWALSAVWISDFAPTHDLFTVNRRKVIEFCDAVAGRGYTWT